MLIKIAGQVTTVAEASQLKMTTKIFFVSGRMKEILDGKNVRK